MSKLTPPSKNNLTRRLKFFLANRDYPKANWEIFNISNLLIVRSYESRQIDRATFLKQLRILDITQGLREPTPEEKFLVYGGLRL